MNTIYISNIVVVGKNGLDMKNRKLDLLNNDFLIKIFIRDASCINNNVCYTSKRKIHCGRPGTKRSQLKILSMFYL